MKRFLLLVMILITITGCYDKVNIVTNSGHVEEMEVPLAADEVKESEGAEIVDIIEEEEKQEDIIIKEEKKESVINTVNLTAVGDIMVHKKQLVKAYNQESDSFDFAPSFEMVKEYLLQSEITIGNLETTLSGKDDGIKLEGVKYYKGYQGYPCFNSPEILAKNLKEVGFNLLGTANNHSMDSWTGGIRDTLDELDELNIMHVGTYADKQSADKGILTYEINNIKYAFLSYTYATNGINPPMEEEYMVNTLDLYHEQKLEKMYMKVKEARSSDVDFVVVMIHFGNEYVLSPNTHQKKIVDSLFHNGADIILGSHPHVLQPIEVRKIKDDHRERNGIVIYSLGNFLSSQIYTVSDPVPKDVGVILSIQCEKEENKKAEIKSFELLPTWVQHSEEYIRVIPVDKAIDNYSKDNHYNLSEKDYSRLKQVKKFAINHLSQYLDQQNIKQEGLYRYNIK